MLVAKVDMTKAARTDIGHFNGASVAARRWDTGEQVDASCSACHGGSEGFRFYVQYGTGKVVQETANGLDCATCHDKPGTDFSAIVSVPSVTFPSGVVRKEPGYDNVCASCHRGREAKATVDAAIAAGKPAFKNVHYLPAAAVKLGSAAHVGYEYDGKTYVGPLSHVGGTQCTSCHDPAGSHHTFQVADAWDRSCRGCHADANGDPKKIRLIRTVDYDGDGNNAEPLAAEIDGIAAAHAGGDAGGRPRARALLRARGVSLLLQGHQRRQELQRRRGGVVERLLGVDGRAVQGGVQLSAVPHRARRVGAQLRLHGPAALRQRGGSGRRREQAEAAVTVTPSRRGDA